MVRGSGTSNHLQQSPAVSNSLQQSPAVSSSLRPSPASPAVSSHLQQSPGLQQSPAVSSRLQPSPAAVPSAGFHRSPSLVPVRPKMIPAPPFRRETLGRTSLSRLVPPVPPAPKKQMRESWRTPPVSLKPPLAAAGETGDEASTFSRGVDACTWTRAAAGMGDDGVQLVSGKATGEEQQQQRQQPARC
ncbi:hypothetical protein RJ55_02900 [Drechmeria coniospora]|nr:hypothetical protein RJ55_02900 [Drechmeria coniospora]